MVQLTKGDWLRLGALALWLVSWTPYWDAAADNLLREPWQALGASATLVASAVALYIAGTERRERERRQAAFADEIGQLAFFECTIAYQAARSLGVLLHRGANFENGVGVTSDDPWGGQVSRQLGKMHLPLTRQMLGQLNQLPHENGIRLAAAIAMLERHRRDVEGLLEKYVLANQAFRDHCKLTLFLSEKLIALLGSYVVTAGDLTAPLAQHIGT
ncbi:hypothetical protein [Pigmentiphaga daeguensis]|uniref:Uncharacterized protein n=1 Tax=Pigmentiphaga daeguensis TaxID=414049 RepID=A0ABP3L984_9BURK